MREHQIVITLKPEQFAQIQQMSKAAGAKSMGIFVRKTLLAALEIEGIKPALGLGAQMPAHDPSLLVDLQRMHGELKDLISESLLAVEPESFDPFADLVDELGLTDEQSTFDEESGLEPEEEADLSKEEPIRSSIKVGDPLNDLLDEKLKTRLESYLEHQKTRKSKIADTRKEPQSEPVSQTISDPDETAKKEEPKAPEPKPSPPRSVPPDQLPRQDKTGFSKNLSSLSGNPPPKKPKH